MLRKSRLARLASLLALLLPPTYMEAQVAPSDSTYILASTQALLDAVTSGDSTVWAHHLAPEWFQSDEEGQHVRRAELLAALHPLQSGQSGKLTLANPYFVGNSTLVVLSYDALEEHHYYGQLLRTTFHTTDIWVRRGRRWLQLASQVTALPQPISGLSVSARDVQPYLGSYELTPAIHLVVALVDNSLVLRREGRPDQPLFALDERLFIRHGVRGFWVFERDSTGAVQELVNWRDNNAVRWRRLP